MLYGGTLRDRFREPNPDGSYKRTTKFVGAGVEKNSPTRTLSLSKQYSPLKARLLNKKTSSEKLKLQFQLEEAEADLETFYQEKERKREESQQEKKKDLEDLKTYKPWGKPAGGAPQVTGSGKLNARRHGIRFGTPPDHNENYNPFGRPGGGAPRVDRNGKVAPAIAKNPELCFTDQLKNEVEITMRYNPKDLSIENTLKPPLTKKWEVTSNFTSLLNRTDSEKVVLDKEKKKKVHYSQALDKQKEEQEKRKPSEGDTEKFIWGKNDVPRNESGKVLPRRWLIGGKTDNGMGKTMDGPDNYLSMAAKLSQAQSHPKMKEEAQSPDDSLLPWKKAEQPSHRKTNQLTDRKPSEHVHVGIDKLKEGRGEGLDAATWIRTGEVGIPKKKVDPATGHVVGGKRCTTDLTFQASRKFSGHRHVEVDKSKESRGDGLDMATWMRAGAVGMPKKNIDPATGHVVGASRHATDLTALVDGKKPVPCVRQSNPTCQQYSMDLQQQAELRQKQRDEERKQKIEQEMIHVANAGSMWGKNECSKNRGFTSMNWLGWTQNKEVVKSKQKEYRRDLQQITEEKKQEQKKEKEKIWHDEKNHLESSDKTWGRPGGGAPRLGPDGKVETTRQRKESLEHLAAVHSGWDFRRTNWT